MCDDPYVPRAEFVALLNGHLKTSRIGIMARRGEIDAIQPGGRKGRWFIRRSEAERLLSRSGAEK